MPHILPNTMDCCNPPCQATANVLPQPTASGQATLVNGVATVFTSLITAASAVLVTRAYSNNSMADVNENQTLRAPGVSFTIQSTSGADTQKVSWAIFG